MTDAECVEQLRAALASMDSQETPTITTVAGAAVYRGVLREIDRLRAIETKSIAKPRFKPGDRVCIPMTGTVGTVLSVTSDRAEVRYDHSGGIGQPLLSILTPGELPIRKQPCQHERTQTFDVHPSSTFCLDCGERLP